MTTAGGIGPSRPRIEPVERGAPIRADTMNRVIRGVNRVESGALAHGSLAAAISAVLSALAPERYQQVRITAVHYPTPVPEASATGSEPAITRTVGGLVACLPSALTYDFVGIAEPGINETMQTPADRPVAGDEARIYPVPVGTVGLIIRSPAESNEGGIDAIFCLPWVKETIARRRCPS